ncbi:hypothetical protein, partial [Deinococcus sp.]|uniref:hypothetical protein n=1 Tax=Deinococcus sp. TaxID=47478 RepID=UPI002869ACFD
PLTTQASVGVPLWRSRVFLTIVALFVGITQAFTTLDLQFAATNSLTLATRHPAAPSSTPSQMTTTCSPATEVDAFGGRQRDVGIVDRGVLRSSFASPGSESKESLTLSMPNCEL